MAITRQREGARPSLSVNREAIGKMPKKSIDEPLWKRVGELAGSSAFLMYLAEAGSDRLTVSQAAFFMLAAAADAKGTPATRSRLLTASGVEFRPSIRNSYRQLLPPSRVYPNALGWLVAEENPQDSREQFLRLSDEGRAVIQGALLALVPIIVGREESGSAH